MGDLPGHLNGLLPRHLDRVLPWHLDRVLPWHFDGGGLSYISHSCPPTLIIHSSEAFMMVPSTLVGSFKKFIVHKESTV